MADLLTETGAIFNNAACQSCKGKGWLYDSTYNRTGEWQRCGQCYGTGWGAPKMREFFAVSGHVKPQPVEAAE